MDRWHLKSCGQQVDASGQRESPRETPVFSSSLSVDYDEEAKYIIMGKLI